MLTRLHAAALITSLFMAGTAFAANDCEIGAATASQKLVMCAQVDASTARQEVKLEFQKLILILSNEDNQTSAEQSETVKPFIQSQSKWISFVEATCSAEATLYAGGTLQGMFLARCDEHHSMDRLNYLKELSARPKR